MEKNIEQKKSIGETWIKRQLENSTFNFDPELVQRTRFFGTLVALFAEAVWFDNLRQNDALSKQYHNAHCAVIWPVQIG